MNGTHDTKPTIGFIGLSAMGSRMAGRLLDAGYPLHVYNREAEKAQPLAARGAHVDSSPRAVAEHADVVLSMVADDTAVEQVWFGADGVIAGARPGMTLIDCSSVYPDTSRTLAEAAQAKGAAMLDAPVIGSTPQAEAGQLLTFVGGDRATYESCLPIFKAIGEESFHEGPRGEGTTMKLVSNAILGTSMQAVDEAIALGERADLDRDTLLDTLAHTAVITPGQKVKLENARADAYPVAFALRLMWKDFDNVQRLAQAYAVPMPVTAAAQQVYAVEQAKGIEEDFSAVPFDQLQRGQQTTMVDPLLDDSRRFILRRPGLPPSCETGTRAVLVGMGDRDATPVRTYLVRRWHAWRPAAHVRVLLQPGRGISGPAAVYQGRT